MDLDFVSDKRRKLMSGPESTQNVVEGTLHIDDVPMEVDTSDIEPTVRQEHSNGANRFDKQAPRKDLDFDNTVSRPIRAHRFRRTHTDGYPRYQQGDYYTPNYSTYHDPDDTRGRAYRFERQFRDISPEALRLRREATFVSAMADLEVKEEREDRRDGDRYRGGGGGGNNKRRRDGELALQHPECCRETKIHR